MEFRHLQSFVAAAQHGSFTRAAEELGVTQAAISQHISALEKELNAQLFDRTSRQIKTTDAGDRFYRYAQQILDLLATAREEIGKTQHVVQGVLTMAVSSVPAKSLLPKMLAEFRGQYPKVVEEISFSDSQKAIAAVENAQAEIGLVGEMPVSSKLNAQVISKDEMILVVRPHHPLASETEPISMDRLKQEPLIFREHGSGSRHCIAQALETKAVSLADLQIAIVMDSNEAIRDAVKQGLGAAFFSRNIVEGDLQDGSLCHVCIEGINPTRSLYLISNKNKISSEACRAFLAYCETWIEQ